MEFTITSRLAAQLYNIRNYVRDDEKAATIEKKIKECCLATQVTRCNNIDCVKDAALVEDCTFNDIRISAMYAGGKLYINLVRNVMYGDIVRIVLHPDGSAEYTLDQIPF